MQEKIIPNNLTSNNLQNMNQKELISTILKLQDENADLKKYVDKRIVYFLEAVQFPIATYDKKGKIIAYNQKASEWMSRILNTTFKELDTIQNTMKQLDFKVIFDHYNRCLSGEKVEFEISGNDKNGEFYCFEANFLPIYSPDGEMEGVNLSGFNITERKKLEKKQKDILIQYRSLFENFPLGILITDKEGNITEANKMAGNLLGIEKTLLNNMNIQSNEWKAIQTDGSPMKQEEFASIIALKENKIVEDQEAGIIRKDGLVSWLSITAAPASIENFGLIITLTDISKRVIAENALKRIEERYRIVVQDQTAFICRYLPDGTLTFINDAFLNFFRTDEPQLLGLNLFQLIHPENWIEFQKSLKKCSHHQNVVKFEQKITLSNFKEVWVSWTNRAIIDENNEIMEYQSVGVDITEKKIIERQEQKLIENLKIIYHDLENFSQLLKTDIFKPTIMTLDEFGITHQEQKVISLVLKGNKNKDIAQKLFMGESTVKKYLTEIYSKLEVKNRVELVNFIKDHQISI